MKKKIGKSFILLGVTTATIAVGSLLQAVIPMEQGILECEAQAYNHSTSVNMLDNVFAEGNIKYLPFIYKNSKDCTTVEKVRADFAKVGLTVVSISPTETSLDGKNEIITTNTKITVKENSSEYTVIIYGDVNEDGYMDLIDAQRIFQHVKFADRKLPSRVFKAGNIANEDNLLNLIDAQRMFRLIKGLSTQLLEIEPTSSVPTTKAPEIKLKENTTITIKVGDSFEQYLSRANIEIATNKYGGVITSKVVITNNINNNVAGNYEIVYTVIDGGLTTKVTRKVIVEEKQTPPTPVVTVTSIEKASEPTKTQYNYGETTIDMTGATIKVNYSDNTSKNVNVTNSMITQGDLSQEGDRTITVTYEGKTVEFVVKVLNKITTLELTETGKDKVTIHNGSYQITTVDEFTLGTLQEVQQSGGSKLLYNQIKNIEVQKDGKNTTDLVIEAVESGDSILLKGKAEKAGVYTIIVSVYEETEEILLEINNIEVQSVLTSLVVTGDTLAGNKVTLSETAETMLTLEFQDQYGKPMTVNANEISNVIPSEIDSSLGEGDIGIIIPEIYLDDFDEYVKALNVKYYKAEGGLASGAEPVSKIGIRITTDVETPSSLNGKEIKIVTKVNGTVQNLCTPITIQVN